MAPPEQARRLIVNADDFGHSSAINHAVIRAHREGILTTTSLMVNGPAAAEAVALARANPTLAVGLHLTLVRGQSALPVGRIPGLVNAAREFSNSPVLAGLRYFVLPGLRTQLRAELSAQFEKFHQTGLPLDHVNGHLNLHLHPTIFSLLKHHHREWRIERFRLTRDPFWLNTRLASGRWLYRASHAVIFHLLSAWARSPLRRRHIRHTPAVFGLLQNAHVDEDFILRLLPSLPAGDSELYSHPSVDEFNPELSALVSPRVKSLAAELGIQFIRYQDLPPCAGAMPAVAGPA